jgi:hypothetical protein
LLTNLLSLSLIRLPVKSTCRDLILRNVKWCWLSSRQHPAYRTDIKLFPTPCQRHFDASRPSNRHQTISHSLSTPFQRLPLIKPTSNCFPQLVNAISTPPAHQTDIKLFPTACQRHFNPSRPSNRHQTISHSLSTPFPYIPPFTDAFPQIVNAIPIPPACHPASHSLSTPFPDSPPVIPTSNAFPQLVNTIPTPPARSARHQMLPTACSTPSPHTPPINTFPPYPLVVFHPVLSHRPPMIYFPCSPAISVLVMLPRVHRYLTLFSLSPGMQLWSSGSNT